MSQADPLLRVQILQEVEQFYRLRYCHTALIALAYFEFSITFSREVRCIWQRKYTGPTILFAINRYATLLNTGLVFFGQVYPWTQGVGEAPDLICNWDLRVSLVCDLAQGLSVIGLVALRMYATWNRSWWIFGLLVSFGLCPYILRCWWFATSTFRASPLPLTGCINLMTPQNQASTVYNFLNSSVFPSAFNIVFESAVLVLTWVKTAGIRKSLSELAITSSLSSLLLRDGTLYFLALLIINVADLITIKVQNVDISSISQIVSSILISRFMLNLRGASPPADGGIVSFGYQQDEDRFSRHVVGNLGALMLSRKEDEKEYNNYLEETTNQPEGHNLGEPGPSTLAFRSTLQETDVEKADILCNEESDNPQD